MTDFQAQAVLTFIEGFVIAGFERHLMRLLPAERRRILRTRLARWRRSTARILR